MSNVEISINILKDRVTTFQSLIDDLEHRRGLYDIVETLESEIVILRNLQARIIRARKLRDGK